MAELLVIEDEERIGQLLIQALGANGDTVTWHQTGTEAIAAAASGF